MADGSSSMAGTAGLDCGLCRSKVEKSEREKTEGRLVEQGGPDVAMVILTAIRMTKMIDRTRKSG